MNEIQSHVIELCSLSLVEGLRPKIYNREAVLQKEIDRLETNKYQREWRQKNPDKRRLHLLKNASSQKRKDYKYIYYRSEEYKAREKNRNQTPTRIDSERSRRHSPGWKAYHSKYEKNKRETNENFRVSCLLRNLLRIAMNTYSNTGKIMSSKKYGIDYAACAKHLGARPDKTHKWVIDHIIPCCAFDLNDPAQVKECFAPKNLRWLTEKENNLKIIEDKKMSRQRRYV